MSEDALFIIGVVSMFWIGWPLWQIAIDIHALKEKANDQNHTAARD
jgi:hypothetical protein